MSSAFERSLRGGAPAAESSSAKPSEARKKKSVRWDDGDASDHPLALAGDASSKEARSLGSSGSEGPLRASTCANAGLGSHSEQGMDHLRVPSSRPMAAAASRTDPSRAYDHLGASSGAAAATAGGVATAISNRKRLGERTIQGGAVRVRTPAKPKRLRPDLTPAAAGSAAVSSMVSSSSSSIPVEQQHVEAGAGRGGSVSSSARATPHNYLRRGGGCVAAPMMSPKAMSPARRTRQPPAGEGAAAAAMPSSVRHSPPLHPSPRSPRLTAAAASQRRRTPPASQALRNVAGGNEEDGEALDAMEENDSGSTSEVSPMTLLSNTLSSVGIAGASGIKPPAVRSRSPKPAAGLPRARGSPGASRFSPRLNPSPKGAAPSPSGLRFFAIDSGCDVLGPGRLEEEGEGGEEAGNEDEFPPKARQSLESRLAAASSNLAAAHKANVDNLNNNSLPSSPFTTSKTVRRRSTSLFHVTGEPSSSHSFVSEEEESITVSSSCSCQHDPECTVGIVGGSLQAAAVAESEGSVEVRDRLVELQGRNSTLEQEKVNLTMALVPLEERLHSKERAWEAERRELVVRADDSLRSVRVAEERCRELEKRRSEMEEERHALDSEVRRLRGEVEQRESKTAESFWQRTVAADREKTRLETELDLAQARVVTLSKEKTELEAELLPIQSEASSLRFRFNESERVASRVLTAEEGLRFSQAQLEVMKMEFAATSAQLTAVQTELAQQKAGARKQLEEKERQAGDDVACLRREMQRLQETICSQADRVVAAGRPARASMGGTGHAMIATQGRGAAALVSSEAARIRHQEVSGLKTELEHEKERTRALQKLVEEGEDERRRMHNAIQDLRGSVRVYVRARPFLASDGEDPSDHASAVVRCGADECSVAVIPPEAPNRAISCAFDHVFGGHASQEDVFKEVSGFVQSALDGFKVCLFSYGQTGSGKTHTMTGSGTGMMRGIVPRAVEHILARVGELQDGPWSYGVQASFLEIYNEELRDLLAGYGDAGAKNSPKLGIKKSADGGTEVAGLTKFAIDTDDQVQGLAELEEIMAVAQRARSVASTAMNAQSSRSHSVFTLWLTGSDESTGTTLKGVLHLVDLAGSERLDRSCVGADAQRLRETQSINKSLSCLADVFSSLSAKSSHVPFRNSKLTFLMQDCLSGDGKALMFVNLSPTAASANETVCSLRFANQVSQVELGKASRQLSLSKPPASRGGRPPSSGTSPTRTQGSRATRASGSGASSASTAPPSPRTSSGSSGGGAFGFGRPNATSGRPSTSSSANSPTRPKRGLASGSGIPTRLRLSSSSTSGPPSPRTLGRTGLGKLSPARNARGSVGARTGSSTAATNARVRGSLRGPVAGRGTGRSSVSGSRLPAARGSRLSGDGKKGGGARVAEKPPGGRTSFSGSARPSSAIARSNPPSPKPNPTEKRPRFSAS